LIRPITLGPVLRGNGPWIVFILDGDADPIVAVGVDADGDDGVGDEADAMLKRVLHERR